MSGPSTRALERIACRVLRELERRGLPFARWWWLLPRRWRDEIARAALAEVAAAARDRHELAAIEGQSIPDLLRGVDDR